MEHRSAAREVSLRVWHTLVVLVYLEEFFYELLVHSLVHQVDGLLLALGHSPLLGSFERPALANQALIAGWVAPQR